VNAVIARRLHPDTPVSFDGGRSWIPAWPAAQSLQARGDDGLAVVLPVNVEAWSMGAGYAAVFSGLFFAGPLSIGSGVAIFHAGGKPLPMLIFALVAFVLGPLPIAAMALLGLRALRRNPALRGKGRAIFALVVAALLAGPNVGGILVYLGRFLFR
jgi:hypothetical protein